MQILGCVFSCDQLYICTFKVLSYHRRTSRKSGYLPKTRACCMGPGSTRPLGE